MNLKKIVSTSYIIPFLKTLITLFIIYFKSKNNKKIIFFYFPVRAYYKNIIEISKRLKKKKKIKYFFNI